MDICFDTEKGVFNYRVCAIITNNDNLLVLKDNHADYFYLPGGRVKFNETAQDALKRELKEELDVDAKIVRPLFLNQSFFNEDVLKKDYHEICIYFLVDISNTDILLRKDTFRGQETEKEQWFKWLSFKEVKESYLYPLFIKERIDNLPSALEFITEIK